MHTDRIGILEEHECVGEWQAAELTGCQSLRSERVGYVSRRRIAVVVIIFIKSVRRGVALATAVHR
jgi:hypothetical protein